MCVCAREWGLGKQKSVTERDQEGTGGRQGRVFKSGEREICVAVVGAGTKKRGTGDFAVCGQPRLPRTEQLHAAPTQQVFLLDATASRSQHDSLAPPRSAAEEHGNNFTEALSSL